MDENGVLLTVGTELGAAVAAIKESKEVKTLCDAIMTNKAALAVCFANGVNAESAIDLKLGFSSGFNADGAKAVEVVDCVFDSMCAIITGVLGLLVSVTEATEEEGVELLPEVPVTEPGDVPEVVAEDTTPVAAPAAEPAGDIIPPNEITEPVAPAADLPPEVVAE